MPHELQSILDVLQDVDKELKEIRTEFQNERDSRRTWTRVVGVFLIGMVLLSGWNLKLDRDACERTNDGRASIKAAFDVLVAASLKDNPSPETLERAEQFSNDLDQKLPELKCDWLPL